MEREVSDCGWCQSAGSVWRGRCQICNVVVAESSSLATKKTTKTAAKTKRPTSVTGPATVRPKGPEAAKPA